MSLSRRIPLLLPLAWRHRLRRAATFAGVRRVNYQPDAFFASRPMGNVLFAPPVWRDGILWRGVAATDNPVQLRRVIDREQWVLLHMEHGGFHCVHEEYDLYLIDPIRGYEVPNPQLHLSARELVDPEIFRPLGTSKQYDVVFNACWVELKRPELMLSALDWAKRQGRPISCLWFGYHWRPEGPALEEHIRAQAQALALPVTFETETKDPAEVNRRHNLARMAMLCSVSEGGPRVMSEAMLADLPYLSTSDTEGGSTCYINRQNGRICAPTPEAMARAMWYVLDHPGEYRPREWALRHMCLPVAMQRLREGLAQLGRQKGWPINLDGLRYEGIDWGDQRSVQKADAACDQQN